MCLFLGQGDCMRYPQYFVALVLPALLWTGAGESSDPQLRPTELPADVLNDCRAVAVAISHQPCSGTDFRAQWIGRTPRGDLYWVARGSCGADGCHNWLVVRDQTGGALTLLAVTGELRLEFGQEKFPAVQTRLELADSYTTYTRYDWTGEHYARTETRLVHRIDGFECADESACQAAAQEALRQDRPDRAVRIWQQVHGVNWI
jgi:hypothetical protein